MWAQDAAAMYAYAAASAAATELTPFTEPPRTTESSAAARQSAAVAQSAASDLPAQLSTLIDVTPTMLQGLATTPSAAAATPAASISEAIYPITAALRPFRRRHRRLQPDRGDHPARRLVAAVPAGAGSGPKRAGRRRTAGRRQSHRGWAVAAGAAAGRLRLGGDPRRRRRGRVDGPLDPGRFPVGAAGLDHGRPRPEDGRVGAAGRELGNRRGDARVGRGRVRRNGRGESGRTCPGGSGVRTVGNGTTGAATAAAADGAATTATIIVVPAD